MLFFESSIPICGVRSNRMIQKYININKANSTPNKKYIDTQVYIFLQLLIGYGP